jgi:hypothetical protein
MSEIQFDDEIILVEIASRRRNVSHPWYLLPFQVTPRPESTL